MNEDFEDDLPAANRIEFRNGEACFLPCDRKKTSSRFMRSNEEYEELLRQIHKRVWSRPQNKNVTVCAFLEQFLLYRLHLGYFMRTQFLLPIEKQSRRSSREHGAISSIATH